MDTAQIFSELYNRIPPLAKRAIGDLDVDLLLNRPTPKANSIAWLIWHTARIHDHHISEFIDKEQLWVTGDWANRFGLTPEPNNTGYGHTVAQVDMVQPASAVDLLAYLAVTHERALTFIQTLDTAALDRIVDTHWDPPVTLGVRLVSVADDALQHVGQANYVRGLLGH